MEDNKKMSLYQILETMNQVIENGFTFDEETGEVTFTTDDLDALQETMDVKLNNIIGYINSSQLEADMLVAQADALNKVYQEALDEKYRKPAERLNKKNESLKKYLDGYMKFNGLPELKKENGTAKYSKSTVCELTDENAIKSWIDKHPEFKGTFLKIKEPELSKQAIKDYLKESAEHEVDGASLIEKKTLKVVK